MIQEWFYARHKQAEGWEWSRTEECTKEEAIAEATRELDLKPGDEFALAGAGVFPDVYGFSGDEITERMNERAGEYIEDCEWPDMTKQDEDELGELVSKVIRNFFEKKGLCHDYKMIGDAEEIKV